MGLESAYYFQKKFQEGEFCGGWVWDVLFDEGLLEFCGEFVQEFQEFVIGYVLDLDLQVLQ